MRVGDEIQAVPSDYTPPPKWMDGRGMAMMAHAYRPDRAVVIYIHPARRFYVVRFDYGAYGSFCESFPMRKG